MKELSVVVIGNGRWARALFSLLTKNQQRQRGLISRVLQYTPPRGSSSDGAPGQLRAAHRADSEDSTMQMTAGALSGVAGPQGKPPGTMRAQADDATMMGMPADAFAGLTAGISIKAPGHQKAQAEDATMTGMTADSLARLTGGISIKAPGHVKADAEDATMMGMTADSLAKLAGGISIKAPGHVKAQAEDATMMGMTADSLAKLAGGISIKAPGHVKAQAEDATMMGMTADSLAKLAGGSSTPSELRDVAGADMILLAMPASAVRQVLDRIGPALRKEQILVHAVGSFVPAEPDSNLPATLISDIVQQDTPITLLGSLAGPAQAEDLEEWSPAALVCGSTSELVIAAVRQVLGCPSLRVYGSPDMVGVEVSRAMASVVALASGVCDVLEFGLAARAVLVSRGAAEISRLGMAFGAKERTFVGLAGIGGLMVASQRPDSADFQLGRLLGSGVPLNEARKQIGRVCDSINMVRDAHTLAKSLGLRMPIVNTLHRWLFGNVEMSKAIKDLLEDPNYVE